MTTSTYVKSAQRVLELLEFFAEWRRPASVGEISQSLGYPQSSTSVLMKSLSESGYFDYEARTGMYVPNVRMSLATSWIQEHLYSEQSLLRLMEKVLERTGHTVMIGARKGIHVRYLHVLQSTRDGRFVAKMGALRPLFHSAAGKMLLTNLPEREVAMLLRKANGLASDSGQQLDFAAVCRSVKATRKAGYAISTGTSMPGAAALSVLLPVRHDQEPMTLSVGGPLLEVQRDRAQLLEALVETVDPLRKAIR